MAKPPLLTGAPVLHAHLNMSTSRRKFTYEPLDDCHYVQELVSQIGASQPFSKRGTLVKLAKFGGTPQQKHVLKSTRQQTI